MRYIRYILTIYLLTTSLSGYGAYEAHEWGTFTSLVGSNGKTQNGMYHEDEPLPEFVHPFGELRAERPKRRDPEPSPIPPSFPCRGKICFGGNEVFRNNIVTQKMETPVIYFYADQAQNIDVNVRFPEGVITDTFPGPISTFPTKENLLSIANGNTTFSVSVLNEKEGRLNYVDPANIYSHARKVNSNLISSGTEDEKFIFYRGIGRFQPNLSIKSDKGHLRLKASSMYIPQAAFLVHVDDFGHGQIMNIGGFSSKLKKSLLSSVIDKLKDHKSHSSQKIASGEQAKKMLVDALVQSGLFKDEAYAMVNTWEHGYLKAPGLRLLYILPSHEVDEILPLKMTPAPTKLVRSFVGRIEILLDTEEQSVLDRVINEGRGFQLSSLGRFAEPILRRVSEVYESRVQTDPQITALFKELILQASDIESGTTSIQ